MIRASSRIALFTVVAVLAMAAFTSTASYARGNGAAALILGGASAYLFSHDQPAAGAVTALGAIIALSSNNRDRWRDSRSCSRDYGFRRGNSWDRNDFRSFDRDDRRSWSSSRDRDDRRGSRDRRW